MVSKNSFRSLILEKLKSSEGSRIKVVLNIAQWTMGISFAILIAASAIIRGFHNEISTKIFNFWGHIHVTSTDFLQTFESAPIELDQDFIDEIKAIKEYPLEEMNSQGELVSNSNENVDVKDVRSFITLPIMLESKTEYEGIFLKASEPKAFLDNTEYMVKGSYPRSGLEKNEILISEHGSKRLSIDTGDFVKIHWIRNGKQKTKRLKVSGIYKTGLLEYDRVFAFTNLEFLQDLQNWDKDQVSGYELILSEAEKAESLNNYIFYEHLPLDWFSTSVTQKFRNIFQWLALQSQNEVVLVVLLGIVVLINLATVLLILIIDRIRMIGILKSFGASVKDIRMIFFSLGMRIVWRSLLIGNVLGIGLCLFQKYFKVFKLSEEDYYLKYVPISIDVSYLLIFNLGVLIAVMLFMLIPSSYIQKIHPLRILRFD